MTVTTLKRFFVAFKIYITLYNYYHMWVKIDKYKVDSTEIIATIKKKNKYTAYILVYFTLYLRKIQLSI